MPGSQEIHAWVARLSTLDAEMVKLAELLSMDESLRAGRFHREADRARYTAAHGILRYLLGAYLGKDPKEIRFSVGTHGKPSLVPSPGQSRLEFNLSHSGDLVLFAFGSEGRVGVDVEEIRADLDHLDLAQRQFSAAEVTELKSLPAGEELEGFFRCWTRKEAYLKARGEGLGYPLKDFTVTLGRETLPEILFVADDPSVRQRWSVFTLDQISGYTGAVVAEGPALKCRWRTWPADHGAP